MVPEPGYTRIFNPLLYQLSYSGPTLSNAFANEAAL